MDSRVISATFATWRPVNGRKVLQLVFEVPIEQQGDVLTMLGAPDDKWCAIALLNQKGGDGNRPGRHSGENPQENESRGAGDNTQPQDVTTPGARTKRKFSDYSLPEQCGMRCGDPLFWKFLEYCQPYKPEGKPWDAVFAAAAVRDICGISSRSELTTNHEAANKWRQLESSYQSWLVDQKYGESVR